MVPRYRRRGNAPGWPARHDARFWLGVRLGLGAALPVFVLGLTFGAEAAAHGWGRTVPLAFSALAFSGSAQFTLLTALSSGTAMAAVCAAVLINARYLVMSVSVNGSLRGGRLWRAVQAQALVDASFVVAHRGGGRFDVAALVGASVPQWLGWVGGTAIGVVAAPGADLMHTLGLDVAFPAFFLLLALEEMRGSPQACLAAAVGATVAGCLLFVINPAYALLAATTGALVGLLPSSWLPADGRAP